MPRRGGLLLGGAAAAAAAWRAYSGSSLVPPLGLLRSLHPLAPLVASPHERPVILLLGDSLVQRSFEPGGWGAALADAVARRADVVLRGLSGYNTRWVREFLAARPGAFPHPSHVHLCVLLLGANDAALPEGRASGQHVPIAEYEENVLALVEHFGPERVVVLTPPPVSDAERLMRTFEGPGRVDRSNAHTGEYARAARRAAEAAGASCVDLWEGLLLRGGPSWEEMLSDGLHFTAEGQAAVWELLREALKAHPRDPTQLPFAVMPPYEELVKRG